jgi:hypothetical protein
MKERITGKTPFMAIGQEIKAHVVFPRQVVLILLDVPCNTNEDSRKRRCSPFGSLLYPPMGDCAMTVGAPLKD